MSPGSGRLCSLQEHPGSLARAPLPCSLSGALPTRCWVIPLAFAHGSICQACGCSCAVWCRGGGAQQGGLACPASRRAPPVLGG